MSKNISYEEGVRLATESITSGKALNKFTEFVSAQGGDISKVVVSSKKINVRSKFDGRVNNIDALGAAKLAAKLGASKMTLDDDIDYTVGLYLHKIKGDTVQKGDLLMTMYVQNFQTEFTEEDFTFIDLS
jgi:pyrimidine-nucleoside phosphorylase